jgi:hypothetical protein
MWGGKGVKICFSLNHKRAQTLEAVGLVVEVAAVAEVSTVAVLLVMAVVVLGVRGLPGRSEGRQTGVFLNHKKSSESGLGFMFKFNDLFSYH